ncbi:MAG: valine--tRNA ligase [Candidatus Moraniibacteriota bacterium]|nr:MAG: valine--tRNA ligase [Candidatus Moranbacteria bacterium]
MNETIPQTYQPQEYEDTISRLWEESGLFHPETCIKKGVAREDAAVFSIVLPPPNVTGTLHLGHAAMLAIEDLFVRFHRMRGDRTLWLPGTDHAAIATQEKVERLLWNEERKTRHDLGREVFLEKVKAFAKNSHDTIVGQAKKMGASLDWSREAFTLDEERSLAVRTAFKRLFDKGILSRGDRIVHWDPKLRTTVSDDEIEWKQETVPFYYFQYGPFVIGTSRPETKFGDKYVVVHPDDERYASYRDGETFSLEWVHGPIIATLIKDAAIDCEFGTGAMTITPWHDGTDFEIAERHGLEKNQIIGFDGTLLPVAGDGFAGLDILEARKRIVETLDRKGLLVRVEENYTHSVATNSRGGGLIEPQIMRQWFVSVNKTFEHEGGQTTLKTLMRDAVRMKNVEILPERFEKIYFHWIDNLRDWCVSRQIWYGHPLPVSYCDTPKHKGCEAPIVQVEPVLSCPFCGGSVTKDPDTLDTWFSSGLWTFSTLGWPSSSRDLETYHPTSVVETGYDILFFWVARMILMSTALLGEVPFRTVSLHGLVLDEHGRKMSKSIGNVIDPLDVSKKFGTDAVRLSLVLSGTPGNDIRLGEEKIESFRNFANKLWNIGRYMQGLSKESTEEETSGTENIRAISLADHWILSRLDETMRETTRLLERFHASLAGELLKAFTWNDLADRYLEVHKLERNDALLRYVVRTTLTLWHPFLPFVTEALWKHLGEHSLLLGTAWPSLRLSNEREQRNTIAFLPERATQYASHIQNLIEKIRAARTLYRVPAGKLLPLFVEISESEEDTEASPTKLRETIESHRLHFEKLAHIGDIQFEANKKTAASLSGMPFLASLGLEGAIDIETERRRIEKELFEIESFVHRAEARMMSESFRAKAPHSLIEETNRLLAEKKKRGSTTQKCTRKPHIKNPEHSPKGSLFRSHH